MSTSSQRRDTITFVSTGTVIVEPFALPALPPNPIVTRARIAGVGRYVYVAPRAQ